MKLTVALLLLTLPVAGAFPAAAQEPGVSSDLAEQRAHILRDIHYRLTFHIPVALGEPVRGEEDIDFDNLDSHLPLELDFRAPAGAVSGLTVNGEAAPIALVAEHLLIAPASMRNGPNRIHLSFVAGNRPLNRNKEYLYTLLVPDRARELFPCFDQPDLKGVFTLTLEVPLGWKAIANGRAAGAEPGGAATKTVSFAPSDTIPTYLFAFAAGLFSDSVRMTAHGPMEAFYRETDTTRIRVSLDSLFRIQDQALTFLEGYTGIPFPFRKFGFVAIPDFQFGGMEHPGAIQYKASALFLDGSATQEQRNARANVLSHETAHMWFGDLVTMRWFNDVWMKEVFANFMADKIAAATQPGSNYNLKFLIDHVPAAYAVDRTEGSNPIRQTLDNLKEAGSMYGNIIYHKAPIMMRQLELQMGAEPFREGLREYLRTYAYGNAAWPDLIRILQKYTAMDLGAWDSVWVNETGRPVVGVSCDTSGGVIRRLALTQRGEDGSGRVWPQVFDLALVYADHVDTVMVDMQTASTDVPQLVGRKAPRDIVFNASGLGYGVFPVSTTWLSDPVMRASARINRYENMLDSGPGQPVMTLISDLTEVADEKEELNLGLLLGQIGNIYWHFVDTGNRRGSHAEHILWDALGQQTAPANRKLIFLAYAGIAQGRVALDTIYRVWKTQQPPEGVHLSEDDYTSLAAGLAVRNYPGSAAILAEQGRRIRNPDRQARWRYLQPSLSGNQAVRDSFFFSLKYAKNREKEAWVLSALSYLHHPLRVAQSEKYLKYSLDWMEDIQRTGDVFFPQSWAAANLGNYQSASAAETVRKFLAAHPNYNPQLKGKILQAADNVFRAQRLLHLGFVAR